MNHSNTGLLRTLQIGSIGLKSQVAQKFGQKSISKKLAIELLNLRGIPAKFAQIKALSSSEDNLLWKESLWLATPLPLEELIHLISQYSPQILEQIEIDPTEKPLVASIGQVQKATLKSHSSNFEQSKTNVALKVQFPNIKEQLLQDLGLMGLAGQLFEHFKEGFEHSEYTQMIRKNLLEELDYLREAHTQTLCFEHFLNAPFCIPKIYPQFSSEKILCSDWIPSTPLYLFLKECTFDIKRDLAIDYMKFYLQSLFELGLIHTDPNPGNFGVRQNKGLAQLVIYDFGSALYLDDQEKLLWWILIFEHQNPSLEPLVILEKLGFDPDKLAPIADKITAYLSIIFEPLLSQTPYAFEKWKRKERIQDLLGPQRMQFMLAAPATLFPILRAFQGLLQGLQQFGTPIYFVPTLQKIKAHMIALPQWEPIFTKLQSEPRRTKSIASSLKIEVFENNKTIVSLSFPRSSLENIESLFDEEMQQTIKKQQISIDDIKSKARQNAYIAMSLFKMDLGAKSVHVFLED